MSKRLLNLFVSIFVFMSMLFSKCDIYADELDNIVFNVTIPTSMPIEVDCQGNVSVAESLKIINNSNVNVQIDDIEVITMNDWELISYDTDPRTMKVNKKQFGLKIMEDISVDGNLDINVENYPAIKNKYSEDDNYFELKYDAIIAPQEKAVKETIAEIIFTINWDEVSLPEFSINYDVKGGNFNESVKKTYTFNDETYILPTPILDGYEFEGWYEDETYIGNQIEIIPKGSQGDKFFYAKWAKILEAGLYDEEGNMIKSWEDLIQERWIAVNENNYITSINSKLEGKLIIKEGIVAINHFAAAFCDTLTEVIFPKSLEWIGDCSFYQCVGLKTLFIPKTVKEIVSNAFFNCSGLEKIEIEDGAKTIGGSAFANCPKAEVYVPNSVTSIGTSAFKKVLKVYYYGEATFDPQTDFWWNANSLNDMYKLYFDCNGGTGVEEFKTIKKGEKIGILPIPVYDGYTFNGWYDDSSTGNEITEETIMPENDFTVYAQWVTTLNLDDIDYLESNSLNDIEVSSEKNDIYLEINQEETKNV